MGIWVHLFRNLWQQDVIVFEAFGVFDGRDVDARLKCKFIPEDQTQPWYVRFPEQGSKKPRAFRKTTEHSDGGEAFSIHERAKIFSEERDLFSVFVEVEDFDRLTRAHSLGGLCRCEVAEYIVGELCDLLG